MWLSRRWLLGREGETHTRTRRESDYLGYKQTSQEEFKEDGSQLSHLFKCLKRFSQRRME